MLEICIKLLGCDNSRTLHYAKWLAEFLADQRQFKEANKLQVRVLETNVRLLGANHSDSLRLKGDMAVSIRRQGRVREALAMDGGSFHGRRFPVRVVSQFLLFLGLHY